MKITRREFLRMGGALATAVASPGLAMARPGGVAVLLYHDISDDFRDEYTVSPSLFAAQMEWLHGNGFRAVPIRDAARRPAGGKSVVITFDDGYASYMDYAFPLFREYRFHSTINVIGSLAGRFLASGGNRPLLSWDEYRHVLGSGLVDIGCHTHDLHAVAHRGALGVSARRLSDDLEEFRRVLKRETGAATDILAWPYGLYDAGTVAIAKKAGFRYMLTSRDALFPMGGDESAIPRKNIDNRYDITSFGAGVDT